jgi:hypothetical protein
VKSEAEHLALQWGLPIAIALMAVAVRLFFRADKLTLFGVVRGVVIGLFVGAMANLALGDIAGLSDGERGAIIGVMVVLAEDLIAAVLSLGHQIRKHPECIIDYVLRGKK